MRKNVTIYNIAKEAGVSITTVSRVINGSPLVSDATRDLITSIIKREGYSPNAMARALSTSESRLLGVVLPDIANPYFSSLFVEIERFAVTQNYSVVLFNTLYGSFSSGFETIDESAYFQMLADKRLDGAIITGGQIDRNVITAAYLKALNRLQKTVPIVIVGQKFEGTDCVFIQRDLKSGVAAAVRHLAELGHLDIGFIGGEDGVHVTTDRFNAYLETLTKIGLAYNPSFTHFSDYYITDGYSAMARQLKTSPPTAIVAINDAVALGAIRAIIDADLKVPQNIAVVSLDEFFFGPHSTPRLTSLSGQNAELGRLAITNLINDIKGLPREPFTIDPPKLIVRESSRL